MRIEEGGELAQEDLRIGGPELGKLLELLGISE